ncbi:ComF family protein [Nakamurella flavida]|uniref:ComF family protein n=1 Tax=Nakamurella flavida TaxID=363630 RepID=A0A938YG04_9ACTN|nr:phosphoribosyltransferase family protein [Nakamurella flavida]MBM9476990.1 ComF family protein [Nakamurella flavida]MDP9779935.1 putative amidophosphoribosyltransferase [Nakamurella flavida]
MIPAPPSRPARWASAPARWVGALRAHGGAGLDLVLPRTCPGCGAPEPWCARCAVTLGPVRAVRLPDAALDAAAGLALPPVYALAGYHGAPRAAVLHGKERGRRDLPARLGVPLGEGLAVLVRAGVLLRDPWLVPAPSRRSAARARGGDPVTAMARSAARTLARQGLAAGVAPCLSTAAGAVDSVGLGARERVRNLAGRVRYAPRAAPPAGAVVVLVDDVVTSGATVLAACRVLADHGRPVSAVLCVAAAPSLLRRP